MDLTKVKIGEIYKLTREFDIVAEQEVNRKYDWHARLETVRARSEWFKKNNFKYVEILDSLKMGRQKKYKIRLFMPDGVEWFSRKYYNKEDEELSRWVPEKLLKNKIKTGHMVKSNWGEIAKEKLLESTDNISVDDNTKIR